MFKDNIIYKIKVSMTKTRWKIINLDVVQRDEKNEKKRTSFASVQDYVVIILELHDYRWILSKDISLRQ